MKTYLSNYSYIDLDTHRLVIHEGIDKEASFRLTIPESNILLCLHQKRNTVVKKEELVAVGWEAQVVGTNSLNVAIYRIRKCLLADDTIELENVPKIGYRLNIEETNSFKQLEKIAIRSIQEPEKVLETNVNQKLNVEIDPIIKVSHRKPSINIDFITAFFLLVINIIIVQGVLIVFLGLVDVKCVNNSSSMTCTSGGYNGAVTNEESGLTVVSNMFSFNNEEINWDKN